MAHYVFFSISKAKGRKGGKEGKGGKKGERDRMERRGGEGRKWDGKGKEEERRKKGILRYNPREWKWNNRLPSKALPSLSLKEHLPVILSLVHPSLDPVGE
jgi:hypothetical protein